MDPDYVPDEKYVVTGKDFKKLTRNAKKLVLIRLIILNVKIINIRQHFQVEKKFILDHQIIQNTLFIKTKREEINILLELKRLKNKQGELTYTNPESSNYWSVRLLWPEKK